MPDTAIAKDDRGVPVGQVPSARPGQLSHAVAPELTLFSGTYNITGPNAAEAFWERTGFSIAVHVVVFLLVAAFIRYAPTGSMLSDPMESIPFHDIVWLNQPGPGGGGGGGGNRMPGPIRKAELPGRDKVTVPVTKPTPVQLAPETKPADVPPPPAALDIPAMAMADSSLKVLGSLEGVSGSLSQGPGSGGGSGTGTGTGIGPGTGSGLGPGWGGGTGGGPFRPGSGIDLPEVRREVKPQYTADAMRAKIQGTVILECVVLPDGTVGQVSILKSLDPVFGLDQEAIKAAKQWLFRPGRKQGQPVAVLVSIELTFTLR
jgi:periplasmic protein TonB